MKKKSFLLSLVFTMLFIMLSTVDVQAGNTLREYRHTNPLYEGLECNTISKDIQRYSLRSGNAEYTSDLEEIVTSFREQLVERRNTIDLYYHCNEEITQDFFNHLVEQLFQGAVRHTGVGNEGDYIRWHYQSWAANASFSNSENGGYDMHLIFSVSYLSDANQEEQVNQAVSDLLQSLELSKKTDYQKVKAIYDYICANISYDYKNLNDPAYTLKHTAYAALVDKTAVCQGYASLFYRLSLEAGVDARVISGEAGEAHAWNIVKLGEKYYNLDSTWDAGNDTYSYFLKNMNDFSDHVRDEEYLTSSFIESYPVSDESYVEVETFFSVDNVKYEVLGEDTVALYDATDVSGVFEIPSHVTHNNKTYSVVEIGYRAFYDNEKLTAVTMPDTITKIQDGECIDWVYYGALEKCTALKNVIFSKNLTYIGKFAFSGDTALENVSLPNKLETIMDEAFNDCSSITDLILPASTTYVGQCALSGTSIVEFTIPKTCNMFHDWALDHIPTLTSIYVEPGHSNYCSLDGILYTNDMSWVVCYPSGKTDKTYRLPDQVTTIGTGVFSGNEYLEELILNNRINESGLGTAILQKTNVSAIEVPSENPYLKSVDGVLFSKDGKTLYLYPPNKPDEIYFIPSGTIHIGRPGDYSFETCKNLEELYIPSSVEKVSGVMWNSNKLKQVVFASESKVTSLRGFIFQECKALEIICLPRSIKTLSDDFYGNEFFHCENLKVLYAASDADIYNCEYFGCQTLSGCYNLTVYGESNSNALSQLAEQFYRPYQDVSQSCDKVLGITFKDTIQSITEGENISLNTVVYPRIKADEILTYTSSDESIAMVDTTGNVRGIKEGICYITATSQDGAYARCQVQVRHEHRYDEGMVTSKATCEKDGVKTYTCSICEATKIETMPATGHRYGEVTYEWSEENDFVIAKRSCLNDTNHVEEEKVNTTKTVTKEPTCTTSGSVTYRAVFENSVFEEQTKVVVENALGHSYGEVTYEWSSDNSTVVAKRICLNNANHVEEEKVNTTKTVTKEPTCTTSGSTTYRAVFKNTVFKEQIKEVVENALGHDFKEAVCTRCHVENSGQWIRSGSRWWYLYSDGYYPAGKICKIGNTWYAFDASGWMQTGWAYYNNTWYYFGASGAMQTGWVYDGGTWYYMNSDGKMATGLITVNGTKYYMQSSGVMSTGWQYLDRVWYYFGASGAMQTGWLFDGATWYYFAPETGKMYANQWLNDTYYFGRSGAMAVGWATVDGIWYYFNAGGSKVTNMWIGNYYLKEDGSMAVNEWVDNERYFVDGNGVWVPNKVK